MKKIDNNQLNLSNLNQKVTLYGFVANKRKMSEKVFVDLRDSSGIVQLVFNNGNPNFTKESVLQVTGIVTERKSKNYQIASGEIEIIVEDFTILSLANNELPFNIQNQITAKDDTRLKYRYLDLRRPVMQQKFWLRYKLIHAIRNFLDNQNFIEIETPYLSKSTPEGARDFLVPTRHQGKFFALPQSPQLYKQILMGSGFEKYYQIVRAFRDEDNRKDRGPEFTQLDLEMAYVEENDIKNLLENMLFKTLKCLNFKIETPFLKIDYQEAIDKYGSDKPDLRFDNKLVELTTYFSNSSFHVLKNAKSIKGIFINNHFSNKQIKELEVVVKQNGAKGLIWANFDNQKSGTGWKFCSEELASIQEKFQIKSGAIVLIGDEYQTTTKTLGALRNKLQEMFNLANDKFIFAWVENFPLFEKDQNSNRYIAAHHPFTSPEVNAINDFENKMATVKARAYDLVCNGFEIGGGSIRINDLKTQLKMFQAIGLNNKQIADKFGFFLEVFKYGLPPHGGIALGIDRLTMILTNSESLREVIAFPKNASGIAIMEEAPSNVTIEQLNEYFIDIKH